MPGYLGGSSGGGTGGEIDFPKELIDPVTKLRVSQPENLIDTDFEYGLQPTKWETLELINNTPSFFSKSGDTTIDGIVSITTNAGTREITVRTALDHGLAVGIPLNVTGSKSITADGAYIINSIPDSTTFTYLCKDNQPETLSIEDLYTSVITGEFFQGSQIRISDAGGMTTDNATPESTITVNLDSTHGFGVNTPFYFLNLNSSLSQQFDSSNSSSKSFDSSNTATAQTFDGSNTLSSTNIDYSNSAVLSGVVSNITNVNSTTDEITVQHGTENFNNLTLATPLYYNVSASTGFFATNPRGVVFLKTITDLGESSSTFQVSAIPDGPAIDLLATFTGTFQIANQARTFSGNNRNPTTETSIQLIKETSFLFDGNNQGFAGAETNGLSTVQGYSGTILVSTVADAGLDYYPGAMVTYSSTGTDATGLVSGTTYFINTFEPGVFPNSFNITVKAFPNSTTTITPSGGSGTQTFQKIGVSVDKDIIHIRDSNFLTGDMIEYTFPEAARFTVANAGQTKIYYFVETAYDSHNYQLSEAVSSFINATGGVVSEVVDRGRTYKVHTFTTVGNTNFVVASVGTSATVDYLVVGGGGGGGTEANIGGGGGAGGFRQGTLTLTPQTYVVTVGDGGARGSGVDEAGNATGSAGTNGGNSVFASITSLGGGAGGTRGGAGALGGSGGGGGDSGGVSGAGTAGQGFGGGTTAGRANNTPSAILDANGGGGAGGVGASPHVFSPGPGRRSYVTGTYIAKGGNVQGDGGLVEPVANTGDGGSAARAGGSGIVVIRYPITPAPAFVAGAATGGASTTDITSNGVTYRVHQFTAVGSSNFVVTNTGSWNEFDYLIVAGGGAGGGGRGGGGGGGGGVRAGRIALTATTYAVVVGAGGAASVSTTTASTSGGNSSAFGIIATGGGRGAGNNVSGATPQAGGSGGGGALTGGATGAQGTVGQGFAGGNADTGGPTGGGGGGAAFAGTNALLTSNPTPRGGTGGDGFASEIRLANGVQFFGAGGGGGSAKTTAPAGQGGFGGRGGGGNGATQGTANGVAGTANTGSGGGGAGGTTTGTLSGAGGSGIVIIRYPIAVV
jgi:hypothetical protein